VSEDWTWRHSVDAGLVNLTSARKSSDIDLDRRKRDLVKVDKILRGDPERNIEGLIESINHLKTEVNKFNRILEKDYLGHGGLISFINYIVSQQRDQSKRTEYKWSFLNSATVTLGTIIVALISLSGMVFLNWDKIHEYVILREHIHQAAAIESATKKLKPHKARRRKPPVVYEEPVKNAPNEMLPE
jgi:hypothetical protein